MPARSAHDWAHACRHSNMHFGTTGGFKRSSAMTILSEELLACASLQVEFMIQSDLMHSIVHINTQKNITSTDGSMQSGQARPFLMPWHACVRMHARSVAERWRLHSPIDMCHTVVLQHPEGGPSNTAYLLICHTRFLELSPMHGALSASSPVSRLPRHKLRHG